MNIELFIILAGVLQLLLVVVSPAIPVMLSWNKGLAQTPLLLRQMFWTYSIYIWVINLSIGLLSAFAFKTLLDGSLLALLISLFISLYWLGRVAIQFFYFSREEFPKGIVYTIGESLLVSLFIFLTIVYSYVSYHNYLHLVK